MKELLTPAGLSLPDLDPAVLGAVTARTGSSQEWTSQPSASAAHLECVGC